MPLIPMPEADLSRMAGAHAVQPKPQYLSLAILQKLVSKVVVQGNVTLIEPLRNRVLGESRCSLLHNNPLAGHCCTTNMRGNQPHITGM